LLKGTKGTQRPNSGVFYYIAEGALSELITQMEIGKEVGLIDKDDFVRIEDLCRKIGSMLTKLIKSRS
jgi:four helix bundle protein